MAKTVAWLLVALLIIGSGQQSAAQPTEPKFDIESVAMPVGVGLPNGKPVDILGLYTGMTATDALPILREHYREQPRNKLSVSELRLPYSKASYVAFARNGLGGDRSYDLLAIAASSNASGNQVVNIIREVRYAPGSEANTEETIASIIGKYGRPSSRRDDGERGGMLSYGYKDGTIVEAEHACVALNDVLGISLNSQWLTGEGWYGTLVGAAKTNLTGNYYSDDGQRCSAYMGIRIETALQNGQYNKNAIRNLYFVFFDAARFIFANNRDVAAQKELTEKARASAPAGKGAPKL